MNHEKSAGDEYLPLILGFAAIAAVAIIWYFYYIPNKYEVNKFLLWCSWVQFKLLSVISPSFEVNARKVFDLIQGSPQKVYDFHLKYFWAHWTAAGSYFRWVVFIFLVFLGYRSYYRIGVDRFNRRFNARELLAESSRNFPCMKPLLQVDVSKESQVHGLWAVAMTPLTWVAKNNLILEDGEPVAPGLLVYQDGPQEGQPNLDSCLLIEGRNQTLIFDSAKCKKLLISQMGPRFTSFDDLPKYQQGLLAALMALAAEDLDGGQALLDQMSASAVLPKEKRPFSVEFCQKKLLGYFPAPWVKVSFSRRGRSFSVNTSGSKSLIEKHKDHVEVKRVLAKHEFYVSTIFHALLSAAIRRNYVCSSQWIWLRPTDRWLWYVLNQVGGRTAWAETMGPWCHFLAEEVLRESIEEPYVEEAAEAVEQQMRDEGWLPQTMGRVRYESNVKRQMQEERKAMSGTRQRAQADFAGSAREKFGAQPNDKRKRYKK